MGTFLFFILKSSVCLFLFTILYITLLKNITHFRFSRWAFWVGTLLCWLIPLIPVSVSILSPIQQSVMMVGEIFEEMPSDGKVATGFLTENGWDARAEHLPFQQGKSEEIYGLSLLTVISLFYTMGAVGVFLFFVYSFGRLWHLIHGKPVQREGSFRLVILPGKVCSFSWWKYIVMSEEDYRQDGSLILIHEKMHLSYYHTLDLGWMHCLLIFHWFNPMTWVLWQELRDLHEYEADEGVISSGVNMVQYQLLLVKKAVGTRLYSMANGFNHSKLKKRITMMLKERTNRWARLKLLLAVPVMAGALYVFAQPEVKEVPRQIQSELQQEEADDYSSLMFFFKEGGERYSKLVNGAYPPFKIKARQVHSLFVNKQNRVMFDNDVCSVDELKSTIVKNLMKSWEESKRKEYQVISFQVDRGSEIAALTTILKEVKGAFEQIRADLSITLTDKSEEALDRLFPVLLSEGAARNYGLKELSMEEKISGIVVTIHTSEGKEVMKDFTLTELKQKVTAARAKQADPESLVIGLKIEKGCKMGYVTDTKQVLRECSALKINYSTDN